MREKEHLSQKGGNLVINRLIKNLGTIKISLEGCEYIKRMGEMTSLARIYNEALLSETNVTRKIFFANVNQVFEKNKESPLEDLIDSIGIGRFQEMEQNKCQVNVLSLSRLVFQ